jgi:hypothetical protein
MESQVFAHQSLVRKGSQLLIVVTAADSPAVRRVPSHGYLLGLSFEESHCRCMLNRRIDSSYTGWCLRQCT